MGLRLQVKNVGLQTLTPAIKNWDSDSRPKSESESDSDFRTYCVTPREKSAINTIRKSTTCFSMNPR